MIYVLAAIGLITVVALLWRALRPHRIRVGVRRQVVAPDDDPDFLRRLGERNHRPDDGNPPTPY